MIKLKGWHVVVFMVIILALGLFTIFMDNRAATEKRAYLAAQNYVSVNSIKIKRLSCSGDSDRDGNGTCNIVTEEGEKISLQCPTNFIDVNVWGATGCKEVLVNLNFQGVN